MSQATTPKAVKAVLNSYDAINGRDLEAMLACLAWDVVIETRVETHRGHEGATRMFKEAFTSEFSNEPQAMLIAGNRVVVLTLLRLTGGMTGIETEQQLLEVWTVDHELVTRLQVMEREEGLESLGLTELASIVEDVRRSYDLINSGKLDEGLKMMHPNLVVDRGARTLDPDPIEGRDALRAFMEPDIFESQSFEVRELIATERRVLVRATTRGRTAGTGIDLSAESFQIWTMQRRQAVRGNVIQEEEEALALLLSD